MRLVTVPGCKYVPEALGMSTGPFVVSPSLRAAIDELEPGVHRYLPITVVSDKKIKGATEHGTHFMLVPPPPIDCIILDESVMTADIQGNPKRKEGDHWGGGIAEGKRLVLDGSKIGSRHLWRTQTGDFKQIYSDLTCSEEFWGRYTAAKMRGWRAHTKCIVK
jgi:hypothetical protein